MICFLALTINIIPFLFFSVCAQELIDSLYRERNVPTILQSLGCITQYVSNFETQVEEITSYIFQKIIQVLEFNNKLSCMFNLFCQSTVDIMEKYIICLNCSWIKLHTFIRWSIWMMVITRHPFMILLNVVNFVS